MEKQISPEDWEKGPLHSQALAMLLNGISKPQIQTDQRIAEARSNLLSFTQYTFPKYEANWHHAYLAERLDAWIKGDVTRLIVMQPSQTGKSTLVSHYMPAYLFGKHPAAKLIGTSHSKEMASFNNRALQRIIDSEAYRKVFPGTQLFGKNIRTLARGTYLRNNTEFEIVNHGGYYFCVGVGGNLAGKPADYLVLDDPYGNYAASQSPATRRTVSEWLTGVFFQRISRGEGRVLITMTPWHTSDVVGELLDQMEKNQDADQWEVVRFPALSEKERPIYDSRIQEDVSLWDTWRTTDQLKRLRSTTPASQWSAMFQMRPKAAGGNLIKSEMFRYFTEKMDDDGQRMFHVEERLADGTLGTRMVLGETCRWFQTVDTAQTVNQNSDYTVIGTWILTPAFDLLLYYIERKKLEIPYQLAFVMQGRDRFPDVMFQAVEDKASGIGLIQQARLMGKPLRPLKADSSKVFRASDVCGMYQSGKVFHKSGAEWLHDFEQELLAFPAGKHDDQVDVMSLFGRMLDQMFPPEEKPTKKTDDLLAGLRKRVV